MNLDIIFRSCSRVHAFHGGRRVVSASKSEIILRCLRSLTRSAEKACQQSPWDRISLTVVDDHSDASCVETIQKRLAECSFPTRFIPMTDRTGNGASLLTTYELARNECEDLIYFVEDDYLHDIGAIGEMMETFKLITSDLKTDIVVYPCDYPDLYKKYYPSGILLGHNRYWRNIGQTTGTFLLPKRVLVDHWDKYMKLTQYGIDPDVCEENSINLVYQTIPCFSPMPSLAVHLGPPECMSPFIEWKKWWDLNA